MEEDQGCSGMNIKLGPLDLGRDRSTVFGHKSEQIVNELNWVGETHKRISGGRKVVSGIFLLALIPYTS